MALPTIGTAKYAAWELSTWRPEGATSLMYLLICQHVVEMSQSLLSKAAESISLVDHMVQSGYAINTIVNSSSRKK